MGNTQQNMIYMCNIRFTLWTIEIYFNLCVFAGCTAYFVPNICMKTKSVLKKWLVKVHEIFEKHFVARKEKDICSFSQVEVRS